jgi:aminocarboxymuconate-semialdehyde decarboxylase
MHNLRSMIVDVHAHCVPPTFVDWIDRRGVDLGIRRRDTERGNIVEIAGRVTTAPLRSDLSAVQTRIAAMDEMGVDVQVLSGWIDLTAYELDPSVASEYARAHNDSLFEHASEYPDRFRAMATVPLQSPAGAAAELERAIGELGMVGIEIATTVDGVWLDRLDLDPLWESAAALGALVLLHPMTPLHGVDLGRYFMDNAVGRPAETTIATAGLIFSGVFDRFPDLRMCVVHGGGFVPFQIGRMDRAFDIKPGLAASHLSRLPSDVLKTIYVDTVVHQPAVVSFLVNQIGADRILLGTDYPFEMGEDDPVRLIRSAPGLSVEQVDQILGGNALRLFERG